MGCRSGFSRELLMYTTKDAAENGIRSVQENAPQAETEDQTQAAAAA